MKIFLNKVIFFILTWIFILIINYFYLDYYGGDLKRISYSYKTPSKLEIKTTFPKAQNKHIPWDMFNVKDSVIGNIDILSIGDSFSDIESSYTDFLSTDDNSVLHVGRTDGYRSNPFQKLIDLINLNIIKSIKPKLIIIESVERLFYQRIKNVNYEAVPNLEFYCGSNKRVNESDSICFGISPETKEYNAYILRSVLKAPKSLFFYNYLNLKPTDIPVHMVPLEDNSIFEPKANYLMFHDEDLVEFKFNETLIKRSIQSTIHFNEFCKKHNLNVVYIIAPDKYDAFYNNLVKKVDYNRPVFFDFWNDSISDFHIIDAYKIIQGLKHKKVSNLYHLGDTHWTSFITEEIANELKNRYIQ